MRPLRELLPEEMPALDVDESSAWHVDVLGYDKPELYLKYYADEKTPPHDRDRHLPQNWF